MPTSKENLSLPAFLKLLTANNVPASKAIAAAGKIYKTHNTHSALALLTDSTLKSLGILEKEDRKALLAAIKKANLVEHPDLSKSTDAPAKLGDLSSVGSSTPAKLKPGSSSPGKKRKRDDFLNKPLPDRPPDEGETYGNSEFNEVLDVEVLKKKSAIINRAPVMTAWAMVVAERLGFQREEALSIASVFTELNAISKGVSLGIFDQGKGKNMEATPSGAQPYVELMGRRVPLYQANINADNTQWRALSASNPVPPSQAYTYITSSFRQTTPFIIGAMRLLAQSYGPAELNKKGFGIYTDFRPDIEGGQKGWGKRGEVKCETILRLLRKDAISSDNAHPIVKIEDQSDTKKPRLMTVEDYDDELDDNLGLDVTDLESLP